MQIKRVVATGYGAVSAPGENVPEIGDAPSVWLRKVEAL